MLHKWLIWLRQAILAKSDLDCDLPEGRRANGNIVAGIGDQRQGGAAQVCVIHKEPQQGVGIQQHPHRMYSLKSCRWSSSSAKISSWPFAVPGWRGLRPAACCLM